MPPKKPVALPLRIDDGLFGPYVGSPIRRTRRRGRPPKRPVEAVPVLPLTDEMRKAGTIAHMRAVRACLTSSDSVELIYAAISYAARYPNAGIEQRPGSPKATRRRK
jgi:hypothetical protein